MRPGMLAGLLRAALCLVPFGVAVVVAQDGVDAPCAMLLEQSNVQLDLMRRHAESIDVSLQGLNASLRDAERRNAVQTATIERLETELRELRESPALRGSAATAPFFDGLRRSLAPSVIYEVLPDRVVIASDPVFVFGRAELGAEGRDRLAPLVEALDRQRSELPRDAQWRLVVEGHSDSRPLRANPRFANNWALSAARAIEVVELLRRAGLPAERLLAVAYASTRPRDPGDDTAAHRRNRRVELRLSFDAGPD